jgi:hypothetical protein
MPGRRNLADETARHAAEAPRRLEAIHRLLVEQLPAHDVALVTAPAILDFLHNELHIRRADGSPVRWRQILRWRAQENFPLLRGGWNCWARCLAPCFSTRYAVTAWVLSRFDTARPRALFAVSIPTTLGPVGRRPVKLGTQVIAERYRSRAASPAVPARRAVPIH